MREGPVWVAVLGEDIIGAVAAVDESEGCCIRGMGVVPGSRARGVGGLVLEPMSRGHRNPYYEGTLIIVFEGNTSRFVKVARTMSPLCPSSATE